MPVTLRGSRVKKPESVARITEGKIKARFNYFYSHLMCVKVFMSHFC